jgi:hypothetical protein
VHSRENRELSILELENVSGGMFTLDFGIVSIEMQFGGDMNGSAQTATICGNGGRCIGRVLGP